MYSTGKHLFVRELGGVRTKVGTVGRRRFSNRIDAMADDDELRAQLVALTARLAAVEEAVRALGGQPRGASPVTPGPAPVPSTIAPSARPKASLENRIGGQLLNRIGILAVLIGVAWFLKLAFDRNWIGPSVRVLIGLLVAGGLVAWSERFRRRGFAAFSYSLKALGTGVAYLSLWAAASVFHLLPVWLVFLAMTAVTVANALLAWAQASELLAFYALAGGLATPGLLASGLGNELFLFSYLMLLNVGALVLVALHRWNRICWAALLGTSFYYIGWTFSAHSAADSPLTVGFLCLFFGLFACAPWLVVRAAAASSGNGSFFVGFPIANGMATWIALLLLFGRADARAGRFWMTLLLAVACLVWSGVTRSTVRLSRTWLGLGISLVTAAIPLQFHGTTVTLCWLGEALVLLVLARARAQDALRVPGAIVLALAGADLLSDLMEGTPHPVAVVTNMHFVTALVGAAVFATVVVLGLRGAAVGGRAFASWTWLAGFASVAFSVTVVVAVSLEIHHYWYCGAGFFRDFCTGYGQLMHRSMMDGFGLSAWWMVYGAGLMAVGFLRQSAFLRWQALGLLAVSIGKVFLSGVTMESQGYRVLSFLGLGVLLLGVSFAYQRDWLRLRG
jgi:uncharacterized membrane protein